MSSEPEPTEFIAGTSRIRWRKLTETVLGGVVLAASAGVTKIASAIVDAHIRLVGAGQAFVEALLSAVLGSGADVIQLSWSVAVADAVEAVGPPAAALLLAADVIVVVAIAAWTTDRVI